MTDTRARTVHCCIDLDWIINRGGAGQMAGHVTLPGADRRATPEEVMTHAVLLRLRGLEVMPTCAHHDALGYCLGHPQEGDPA